MTPPTVPVGGHPSGTVGGYDDRLGQLAFSAARIRAEARRMRISRSSPVGSPSAASSSAFASSILISSARPHGPVGGDEGDLQARPDLGGHQRFFWISAHFFSTSSRPPHMKKACSATWSYSPSAILLNASMVSTTGTVEPSMPVNCLAT